MRVVPTAHRSERKRAGWGQDRLRAYPAMIALLGAFIFQQLRLYCSPTLGLTLLTFFDAFVVWLPWREYQGKRTRLGT